MKYYYISSGDGETSITEYTEEQLLKELNSMHEDGGSMVSLDELITQMKGKPPHHSFYDDGGRMIIKGVIVTPQPVKVAKEYKL